MDLNYNKAPSTDSHCLPMTILALRWQSCMTRVYVPVQTWLCLVPWALQRAEFHREMGELVCRSHCRGNCSDFMGDSAQLKTESSPQVE